MNEHALIGRAIDLHAVFEIAHEHGLALLRAVAMRGQREQRARVRREALAMLPRVVERILRVLRRPVVPRRHRVHDPRVRLPVAFVFFQMFVEPRERALHALRVDVHPRVARDREAPHDVCRHVGAALVFFPPPPPAVAVLEVVEPRDRRLRDVVEPRDALLRVESHLRERLRDDRGGEKAAHRLFGAAVRIVDEVRQRIEHRDGQTRRDLHDEIGRAALARKCERDDRFSH